MDNRRGSGGPPRLFNGQPSVGSIPSTRVRRLNPRRVHVRRRKFMRAWRTLVELVPIPVLWDRTGGHRGRPAPTPNVGIKRRGRPPCLPSGPTGPDCSSRAGSACRSAASPRKSPLAPLSQRGEAARFAEAHAFAQPVPRGAEACPPVVVVLSAAELGGETGDAQAEKNATDLAPLEVAKTQGRRERDARRYGQGRDLSGLPRVLREPAVEAAAFSRCGG